MRLEKRIVHINQAVFDEKSYIEEGGILHLCKEEILRIVMDPLFKCVDIELVHPGENCRILMVADCVEPMYKPDGMTFPGVVDDFKQSGSGITIALNGVGVTEVLLREPKIPAILDMSGAGAEHTATLPKLIHVCIIPEAKDTTSNDDYFNALNIASKRVAKFIASLAAEFEPDEVETYELAKEINPDLPKVAYIFQIFSHAPLTDTMYYGDSCVSMLPTLVHPNEILDGAILFRDYYQICNASPSCVVTNHPVIKELYERHGKDICFAGVIVSNTPAEIENKKRNSMLCAGLAKYHLNADCAVITKEGGGHPQIDIGLNCDACESLGIKTAILLTEMLANGSPVEELVLFTTPNANAIVTNGCAPFSVHHDAVDRVVGKIAPLDITMSKRIDPYGAFDYIIQNTRDSINQIGNTEFTSVVY